MATLPMLEADGALCRYEPELDHGQQELRLFYVFPRVAEWMERTLPILGSTWNIEETPLEQLDALLAVFCAGDPLSYGQRFKPLNALGDGVWELKTADLRIFGWFPRKDCFVATDADLARTVKSNRLYRPYAEQAVRFRDRLGLDEPKFVPGEDPLDVVSDFYYP
jgi:hypothetical protein